jgi:tripartite-type tricarboxylate transporter receptor subunit TctC
MNRRQLTALAAATFLFLTGISGFAQNYPDRPIRVIVPFSAGGGTDTVTRAVMRKVSEAMGQAIVIDNKLGAGGMIGLAEVARAKPDGYTLGVAGSGLDLYPLIFDNLTFNPTVDLVPVAPLASTPMALIARNSLPGKTSSEVFALARSNPAKPLTYGTPGIATPAHQAGVLLASTLDITMTHVPYKGTAPVIQDVAGGQVDLGLIGLMTAQQFAQNGKLRLLGVIAPKRSPVAPEVPTLAEGGVRNFDATYWWDITAPKGIPQPIMDRLRVEISKAVQSAEVREILKKGGFEPMVMTPVEYERALKDYSSTWGEVIRKNNIRASD